MVLVSAFNYGEYDWSLCSQASCSWTTSCYRQLESTRRDGVGPGFKLGVGVQPCRGGSNHCCGSLFSHSGIFDSSWPHGLQHARLPCSSPSPRAWSNSCPLSWWSNHLILCHPLLLLPSIFPSIWVFSIESVLRIRWPKYWSFNFSISPSNEYSGLISFRVDWFGLLAVQGTLRSLLQHHSSKASIIQCSAFFMVQLSHPYMTTGKTIALTRQTFVGKVMSLLFNTLSRFVIAFLPRKKCLLIWWLRSPSSVILKPKKIKSATVSIVPSSICHEVMWLDAMILVFWMLS